MKRNAFQLVVMFVFAGMLCFGQSSAGVLRAMIATNSQWDSLTAAPSSTTQRWFEKNAWRMLVYSPYFDSRLSWYPNGWAYLDLYAIYVGGSVAASHPDWILKDSKGTPLYIPYECAGGTCPQYAGDVSNAAFRSYWISQAQSLYAKGYHGLWIDDVNLELRVSNGNGATVAPIDRATGQPMTLAAWKSYMATFTEEIRSAFPMWEIVHNAIWFAGSGAGTSDPAVAREIQAADYIFLERGVSDPGITGGAGGYSLSAFFAYIDGVHQLGRSIIMDTGSPPSDYGLAASFLVSNGRDAVGSASLFPNAWPPSYQLDLGSPLGPRITSNGLICRQFEHGIAIVNGPGNAPVKLALSYGGAQAAQHGGSPIILRSAQGVVLPVERTHLPPGVCPALP